MTLKMRLLAARQRSGLTQQEVADKIGITQPGYARLETGKVRSTTYIAQLAQALGVNSVWLATGSGEMTAPLSSSVAEVSASYGGAPSKEIATSSKLSDLSQVDFSRRQIPLLTLEQTIELRAVLTKWRQGLQLRETDVDLITAKELSMDAFALRVEGISMEPEFRPGDTLIIDPDAVPRAGCFVVAVTDTDSAAVVRKYRERGKNAEKQIVFELVPTNQDFATTTVTTGIDGRVIGVVVEHRRKMF